MPKLTYKSSGVNYDFVDEAKRIAQTAGAKLTFSDESQEVPGSRGESAAVVKLLNKERNTDWIIAYVQEGLGTKSLVADEMATENNTYYEGIAYDTVAMIVNDLITVGAKPISIAAYWAVGESEWFKDKERIQDLTSGWEKACKSSEAKWNGGETPILQGIIKKGKIDLGGTGIGVINPKERLTLGDRLTKDDAIILFQSSGIHANGITLARKLAETLSQGYKTRLPSGRMYGEALLDSTIIYSKLIQSFFANNIDIHYMVNITGHGWRKLMRHTNSNLQYIINGEVPEVPEVLKFIQVEAELDDKEAYATFNMGAGFAIFVPQNDVQNVLKVAKENNIKAYNAGIVQEGEKQVIIQPKNIIFSADSLRVR